MGTFDKRNKPIRSKKHKNIQEKLILKIKCLYKINNEDNAH